MKHFKINEHPSYLHLDFLVPASSNALSLDVARELIGVRKKFAKWRGAVVVSSAHASMFCSGGNLSDYKKLKTRDAGLKVNREITRCLDAFGAWPVVKLAVVEGDVLGGGMEWLARFDYRWCTPQVLLSFWQKRIGLSSGWGGGRAWADKIGEEQMRRLLLEARIVNASAALQFGLVDRVVSPWKIREEAAAWCTGFKDPVNTSLLKWSASSESKTFSSLWLNETHKSVLQKWKR